MKTRDWEHMGGRQIDISKQTKAIKQYLFSTRLCICIYNVIESHMRLDSKTK